MKNTLQQVGNGWHLKSEIYQNAVHNKKKKSSDDMLNLFGRLLFKAIILAIGLTAVTGFAVEILDLF